MHALRPEETSGVQALPGIKALFSMLPSAWAVVAANGAAPNWLATALAWGQLCSPTLLPFWVTSIKEVSTCHAWRQ